jgi:hypothetical protein
MLSVANKPITLSAVMLNVIMLSVVVSQHIAVLNTGLIFLSYRALWPVL